MTLLQPQSDEPVNIYTAKTQFSRLVARVEDGESVTITKSGKPVARLIPFVEDLPPREFGLWRGQVHIADDFDEFDAADEADWYGE